MAHWIKEYNRPKCQTFLCSDCGKKVYFNTGRFESVCGYPNCPYCGHEMDLMVRSVMVGKEEVHGTGYICGK